MKKMIAFFNYFFIILLLIAITFVFTFGLKVEKLSNCKTFEIFSEYEEVTIVSNEKVETLNSIKSGNLNYYTFPKKSESQSKEFVNNRKIEGLVFYFTEEIDLSYFQRRLDFNISFCKQINELQVYYGYLEEFDDFILSEGKKVNVQLVKNSEGWIMGLPLILTGF